MKTQYSEQEVHEMLEALFLEKKRNKELLQQLSQIQQEYEELKKNFHSSLFDHLQHEATSPSAPLEEFSKLKQHLEGEKLKNQELYEDFKQNSETIGQLQQEIYLYKQREKALEATVEIQTELHERLQALQTHNEQYQRRVENLNGQLTAQDQRLKALEEWEGQYHSGTKKSLELQEAYEKEQKISHELRESKALLQQQFSETRLHAEQLEKGIQYLRSKLEDAQTDKELLGEEFADAQKEIKNLKAHLATSQQEAQNVKELEEELVRIHSQFEKLRNSVRLAKEETETQTKLAREATLSLENFQKEKSNLEVASNAQLEHLQRLENDLLELKETLVKALEETHDIEKNCLSLSSENAALDLRLKEIISREEQRSLELEEKTAQLLKAEIVLSKSSELEAEKKRLEEKNLELQRQISQLSSKYEETFRSRNEIENKSQKLQEFLNEKDRIIESKNTQISQLSQEKYKILDQQQQYQRLIEEKESQIKMSQTHFAKKVKETTLYQEQIEEQKMQLIEHQNQLLHFQAKMAEYKSQIENRQNQEKRLEEMLSDSLSASGKWEEKYFQLNEKYQEVESRNKELRKFEEKCLQMQKMFSTFGNVLQVAPEEPLVSSTPSLPLSTLSPPSATTSIGEEGASKDFQIESQMDVKSVPLTSKNEDLFSLPPPPPTRFKQTFFDS